MNGDYELNREARGLKSDKIMTERAVNFEKNRWAELLKGEVGQDMKDVLSGKKYVKLTKWQKLRYKIDNFLNLFN